MIETTILGTSSMVPTKTRNHTSIILNFHNKDFILFDCGEGTQRQLKSANIKATKITKIFISHWHGDHTIGLVGLLQTIVSQSDFVDLKIYGPKGTIKKILGFINIFQTDEGKLDIEGNEIVLNEENQSSLKIIEFKNNDIIEFKDYSILVKKLDHSVESYGFRFIENDIIKFKKSFVDFIEKEKIEKGSWMQELKEGKNIRIKDKNYKSNEVTTTSKGKIISFVFDTQDCDNILEICENSDLVISESTYIKTHENKAYEYKHLTAEQIAKRARNSNAKKLVLIHFSQRYKTIDDFLDEAKEYFENTYCANDFDIFKL